ncbi:2905_t:CDS:2, partial [Entrophospora sp. SA101]
WNQEPSSRPNMPTFLNKLFILYRSHSLHNLSFDIMTLEDGIKLHEDKSETPSPQLSKSPPSAPISSNIVDKEENYMQQKNEDSNSFSHPSIITTESTGTDSLQIKFDKILDL